jgi:hypothetical protein
MFRLTKIVRRGLRGQWASMRADGWGRTSFRRRDRVSGAGFDRPRPNGRVGARYGADDPATRRCRSTTSMYSAPAHYLALLSPGTVRPRLLDEAVYGAAGSRARAHEASIVPVESWRCCATGWRTIVCGRGAETFRSGILITGGCWGGARVGALSADDLPGARGRPASGGHGLG